MTQAMEVKLQIIWMILKAAVMMMETMPNTEEREDQKMTTLAETLSVNIAIKPIFHILQFIHI